MSRFNEPFVTRPARRSRAPAPFLLALLLPWGTCAAAADDGETREGGTRSPLCVYVSSYHRGYSWSDGVERGLREALGERCRLVQFDMDTKRRRSEADIRTAAADAAALIGRLAPDVVITSDDNAARHLIVPHLRGGEVPVVFSGINWTVEEYAFPASNVTGIVEVAPIRPMLREALTIAPDSQRAVYIGARTLTEQKNFERISEAAASFGVTLDSLLVDSLAAWKEAHDSAQDHDFLVIGSHSGIDDWDIEEASAHALAHGRRPSLTNHEWMMPVSAIGYTKLPEEHGERAALTALAILDGTAAADIPMVVNRKWDSWINTALAEVIETPLPERLVRKAKQVSAAP